MSVAFAAHCNFHCSTCVDKCHMIDFMEKSTNDEFYQILVINVKTYAKSLIIKGYIDDDISKQFVEKTVMTILCEKKKYLSNQ